MKQCKHGYAVTKSGNTVCSVCSPNNAERLTRADVQLMIDAAITAERTKWLEAFRQVWAEAEDSSATEAAFDTLLHRMSGR